MSVGLAGGILSIWNLGMLNFQFSFSGCGFVGICFNWKISGLRCFLVNVYSPCNVEGKRKLWADLIMSKRGFGNGAWCIAGDFNAIITHSERKGVSTSVNQREIDEFRNFVDEMELVDVPMLGKKFTWFSANGKSRSKIDRFLLSEDLITEWQISAKWVGNRDTSDHCPIWLMRKSVNWGPKPFRFNDCWLEHKDFRNFVVECWNGFHVNGWKMYTFKEKLKLLKEKLRWWNKEVFGYVDLSIEKTVAEMNELDELACNTSQVIPSNRKALSTQFWKQIHLKESLIKQKSRAKWIAEGDANTKYFHACLKARRRRNQMTAIKIGMNGWRRWLMSKKGSNITF